MIETLPVTTTTTITTNANANNLILPPKYEHLSTGAISIDEVVERVNNIQDLCEDFYAPTLKESVFRVETDKVTLAYTDSDGVAHRTPMTAHSLNQLAVMVGVPAGYIRRCVEDKHVWGARLAEDNMNTWMQNSDNAKVFIREYDDSIRGVLSSRYSCYDAPAIAELVANDIDFDEFDIKGHVINEERLHLRIVNKKPIVTNTEDKDLFWGFLIDSSDVGRSSVSIRLFIWKQICTNGLVMPLSRARTFSHVHRGFGIEFKEGIEKTLLGAGPLVTETVNFINKASDISVHDAVFGDRELLTERLAKSIKSHVGVTDKEVDDIFAYIRGGVYPATLWGVVNAVTLLSQRSSLERRLDIEKGAGRLLMTA